VVVVEEAVTATEGGMTRRENLSEEERGTLRVGARLGRTTVGADIADGTDNELVNVAGACASTGKKEPGSRGDAAGSARREDGRVRDEDKVPGGESGRVASGSDTSRGENEKETEEAEADPEFDEGKDDRRTGWDERAGDGGSDEEFGGWGMEGGLGAEAAVWARKLLVACPKVLVLIIDEERVTGTASCEGDVVKAVNEAERGTLVCEVATGTAVVVA